MKFICTKTNLSKALSQASKSVGHDSNLPVLANVLLQTENGRLKMAATNLEIGLTCYVVGKVEKDGGLTVPARLLFDYVNTLPTDKVTLTVTDNILRLTSENYSADIKGIEIAEFPLIPEVKGESFCELRAGDLKGALSQVVFACAIDEARPEISGVYVKFDKNTVTLTATDGYRLAEKIMRLNKPVAKSAEIIVPAKTMSEIQRLLPDSDELVSLQISENQIRFAVGDLTVVSRLIDGKFPEYRGIIPERHVTKAKLDASEFSNSLKATSYFAQSGIYDVHLKIDADGKKMKLTSQSAQVGSNETDVKVDSQGETSEAVFNYRYVMDGLNNLGSQEAILELNRDTGPGVLRPQNNNDYIYLIMPIKQ